MSVVFTSVRQTNDPAALQEGETLRFRRLVTLGLRLGTSWGRPPMSRVILSSLALLTSLVLADCGGSNGTPPLPAPPPTPTGVQATPGDGQVTVKWTASTGATSYNLYWSTTSGVTKGSGTKLSNVANPYVHKSLTNEVAYYYVVTAENAAGESTESPEASAVPYDANLCIATTPSTLVACGSALQAGTRSTIEIRGSLVCSGPEACRVKIDGMPVTVRGAPGASIRRIDHHDYPLFQVLSAPSAVITDLVLDEDADVPCVPVSPTNPPIDNTAECARTIDLFGVAEVTLDHLTIASSKSVGAEIGSCDDVSITHVRFIASYVCGLEVGQVSRLSVKDTLFWHIASNAFVLSDSHGTAAAPLLVSRSLFDHNHRDDVYFMCGPDGHMQCSGGQILLYSNVDFLRIEQTVIRLGFPDVPPPPPATGDVTGVEFNPWGIHDVTFSGDDIHTHGESGVFANSNPPPVDIARVSFVNNKLYDNGTDPVFDPPYTGLDIGNFPDGVVTESGTCHSADCASVPFGALWALPGGAVSWATNDLGTPRVTVNGTLVGTAANGEAIAPSGATVVLFDGSNEIDRLTVP
jgi:hypothetical protein